MCLLSVGTRDRRDPRSSSTPGCVHTAKRDSGEGNEKEARGRLEESEREELEVTR